MGKYNYLNLKFTEQEHKTINTKNFLCFWKRSFFTTFYLLLFPFVPLHWEIKVKQEEMKVKLQKKLQWGSP